MNHVVKFVVKTGRNVTNALHTLETEEITKEQDLGKHWNSQALHPL